MQMPRVCAAWPGTHKAHRRTDSEPASRTSATRPSIPLRKSTGWLARNTFTREGIVPHGPPGSPAASALRRRPRRRAQRPRQWQSRSLRLPQTPPHPRNSSAASDNAARPERHVAKRTAATGEWRSGGRSPRRSREAPAPLSQLRFELVRPASAKLSRRSLKTAGDRFDQMEGSRSRTSGRCLT